MPNALSTLLNQGPSSAAGWQVILSFVLVACRVGGFIVACPVFLPVALNRSMRTWCGLLLSLVLCSSLPPFLAPAQPLLALMLEFTYGLVMGLAVRLSVLGVYFAGEIIDLNAGYNFSQQINPLTLETTGPVQHLSQLAAGLLFFALGGQQQIILGLARSCHKVPPGSVVWQPRLAWLLLEQVHQLFMEGLRLAAPILASLLATQIVLAMLSRIAPQLNIWGIGFAVIAAVAVCSLYAFAPAWVAHVARLWRHAAEPMGLVGALR